MGARVIDEMKCKFTRYLTLLVATIIMIAAHSSCSLKKNTAASRQYTAFITRYNIYYNGDKHYKETLDEMEKKYEDDYSRILYVHPAEARADEDAPQPAGDFTRSIEKAQKAIQVRSIKKKPAKKPGKSSDPEYKAWMAREEYNPFLHNAWMLMGRSQFHNGDFLGASSTFFYVSKHFTWLPDVVTEAKLWQARSYCSIDWLYEAEIILTRIKPEQLVNKTLTHLYNLAYADFFIQSQKYAEAIPYVEAAAATAKGAQKTRLNFLLGQLYARDNQKQAAYKAFDKAGSASSATYRTKFNARIKQSEVFEGEDITSEVKALRRMTRYDRNKEYLDQIYYAIGNLYLSRGDTLQAISNYVEAVKKSTRSGIDKALTQLTLGGLYYDRGEYALAQPCYSEALPLIPETYPNYKMLQRRSDYLDELAVYEQNVTLQDSLLELSYLSLEEQTKVAERLVEELKKREAEEAELARKEEARANAAANASQLTSNNAPTTFTMSTDNSWYFYNPSTVTAGKTDFQRKWGSRKLEDNWRRRNKASYAFETTEEEDTEETDDQDEEGDDEIAEGEEVDLEAIQRQNDPHYVEYYLKQIPKDDQERLVANDVVQEGLYNMGIILKDKLEDFPAARAQFDELLTRYPDNVYRLDTYYNLYLMAVRSGDSATAEYWCNLVVTEFPDSPYGQAMRDPQYIDNLRRMDTVQNELYDQAYQAYLDNNNQAVHDAYEQMSNEFPLSKLMPKFMFIHALSYVTENNPDKFKEVLTLMLERYPDTDLTPYAASYLKGMDAGRKLNSGVTNMRGMIWDIRLGNDSTAVDSSNPLEFELNAEEPQLFILLYPTDVVSPNELLYNIARHNFSSFVVKDFDLEQMNFGRLGLLIVKPFANVEEINHYRSVLYANTQLQLPAEVRPVVISQKNFDTLLHSNGSFDDYFRYVEDKTYRDTEERVLPPEFYGNSYGITEDDATAADNEAADENATAEENVTAESTEPVTEPIEATVETMVTEAPDTTETIETSGAVNTSETVVVSGAAEASAGADTPETVEPAEPAERYIPEQPTAAETPAEAPDSTETSATVSEPSPASTPVPTTEPTQTPSSTPTTAPAQTQATAAPTAPASTPVTTTAPAPTMTSAQPQVTATTPATAPTPKKQSLPEYPAGSEGEDDPLLD